MKNPDLILLSDYKPSEYLEQIHQIFVSEVANGGLSFLDLPIMCPYHPSHDNKHFSFWHSMSEKKETSKEEDRILDFRRCERVKWISYVIKNANDKEKVWCWENERKTKRGLSRHIVLYLYQEQYIVILRKKLKRLELVTAYIRKDHNGMIEEKKKCNDPRN
ncbi:MAG: hypothetical protein ACJAS6_001352 [Rickettsiales bacterium]|jgi:hypothetical protein